MLGLEHGVNRLTEHEDGWSSAFQEERAMLETALGVIAVAIEHIGSTAVPGLSAKPILDINVGIVKLDEWECCRAPLERLGYDYAERAGVPGHYIFGRGRHAGERTHLVHVVEYGGEAWRSDLAFRDALRADPVLRARYAEIKRLAVLNAPVNRGAYNDLKRAFIEESKSHIAKVE